jgi:hypothetical protein
MTHEGWEWLGSLSGPTLIAGLCTKRRDFHFNKVKKSNVAQRVRFTQHVRIENNSNSKVEARRAHISR